MEMIEKTKLEIIKTISKEERFIIKDLNNELKVLSNDLNNIEKEPDEILIPNDSKFYQIIQIKERIKEINKLLK